MFQIADFKIELTTRNVFVDSNVPFGQMREWHQRLLEVSERETDGWFVIVIYSSLTSLGYITSSW